MGQRAVNPLRLLILFAVFGVGAAAGQMGGRPEELWRFEGKFTGLTTPVGLGDQCGKWNAFFDSSGYFYLNDNSVTLEGLGCTLPLADGTDADLHPCNKSAQMDAWLNSPDKDLLPAVSFRPFELNRETGAFRLSGEAIHGVDKVCFETTGTATLAK
jgi:hypothetical protein